MSDAAETMEEKAAKPGRRKRALIAAPVALILLLAGLGLAGVLPGFGPHKDEAGNSAPPAFVEVPEMVANLNGGKRPSYVKLTARIEVPRAEDAEKVRQAMPRIQDMLQTYLREMRPEELRGSAGVYRLREELLNRVNIAVAPARVNDVLFTQMLIQ